MKIDCLIWVLNLGVKNQCKYCQWQSRNISHSFATLQQPHRRRSLQPRQRVPSIPMTIRMRKMSRQTKKKVTRKVVKKASPGRDPRVLWLQRKNEKVVVRNGKRKNLRMMTDQSVPSDVVQRASHGPHLKENPAIVSPVCNP